VIEDTQTGEVRVLRMVHGKANALDIDLCQAIIGAFSEDRSSSTRAVVLIGQGQIFSAGVDLLRLLDGGASYAYEFLPLLSQAIEAVFFHPKPVVTALNGHAIAGGCVLACASDHRFMVRGPGRIGVTELLVGVPFPPIALEVMRAVLTPQAFRDMVYGGETYSPDIAAVVGIVDEVTESEALLQKAITAAQSFAALRAETFALTKQQSRAPVRDYLQRVDSKMTALVTELWTAPETAKYVRDYVSRTFGKIDRGSASSQS
jgi:enoyl-CoA hydratase/carnithine racemase